MIKVAITYFYQIRFFKPYMIPMSTAVWDPKWYHNFKTQDVCYIDRNGVVNGLRMEPLMPGKTCDGLCRGRETCATGDPDNCDFLKEYAIQLSQINFEVFMKMVEEYAYQMKNKLGFEEEPMVVFIVHEKYDNSCSERAVITDWFKQNGVECNELVYPIQENY